MTGRLRNRRTIGAAGIVLAVAAIGVFVAKSPQPEQILVACPSSGCPEPPMPGYTAGPSMTCPPGSGTSSVSSGSGVTITCMVPLASASPESTTMPAAASAPPG
jgi:hypothetical protein